MNNSEDTKINGGINENKGMSFESIGSDAPFFRPMGAMNNQATYFNGNENIANGAENIGQTVNPNFSSSATNLNNFNSVPEIEPAIPNNMNYNNQANNGNFQMPQNNNFNQNINPNFSSSATNLNTFNPVPEIEPAIPNNMDYNNQANNGNFQIPQNNNFNQNINPNFSSSATNLNNFNPVPEIEPAIPNNMNYNNQVNNGFTQTPQNNNFNQNINPSFPANGVAIDNVTQPNNFNSVPEINSAVVPDFNNNQVLETNGQMTSQAINATDNIFGQPITPNGKTNVEVNEVISPIAPIQVEIDEPTTLTPINNSKTTNQPIAQPIAPLEETPQPVFTSSANQANSVSDMYVTTGPVEKDKPHYGRTEEEIKEQQNNSQGKSSIRFLIIVAVFLLLIILFLPKISSLIIQIVEMIKK